MDTETRTLLLLSFQRALLGAVGPGLLAACADYRDNTVILTFFVRSDIDDDEREDLDADAATCVIADFPDGVGLDLRIEEVDPASTDYVRGAGEWVFLRREFSPRASVLEPDQ